MQIQQNSISFNTKIHTGAYFKPKCYEILFEIDSPVLDNEKYLVPCVAQLHLNLQDRLSGWVPTGEGWPFQMTCENGNSQ